jgi:hypothetical protein
MGGSQRIAKRSSRATTATKAQDANTSATPPLAATRRRTEPAGWDAGWEGWVLMTSVDSATCRARTLLSTS